MVINIIKHMVLHYLKSVFPRSCPSHRILTVIVTFCIPHYCGRGHQSTLPELTAEDICPTSFAFSSSNSASCFFDWSICVVKNDSPIKLPASFNKSICLDTRFLLSSRRSNWLENSSMMLLNFSYSNCLIAVLSSANSCL